MWTWEIPLYFWFGGIAAGSSFVALACDLAGDEASAAVARKVALGALVPSPPLLIMDLGRPERFYNMLRIFKPRSPMSMGAWALTAFGGLVAAAVGADLLGRRREAQALGAATAVRRRLPRLLHRRAAGLHRRAGVGPLAALPRADLRLHGAPRPAPPPRGCVLVATGLPVGHPTRSALGTVETGAMAAELILSIVNERRLGPLASGLRRGAARPAVQAPPSGSRAAGSRCASRASRVGPGIHHLASVMYLAAGLLFRYAWVGAGRESARHDEVVAEMARESRHGS